jgi:ubiquinone/menaquinone biosynthesis C-methylase UbiE
VSWQSYDDIAERYDRIWSSRFEAVARHIWSYIPPSADQTLLDIGTGTGIVPQTRYELVPAPRLAVGCDPSAGMLSRARFRVPRLGVTLADATVLPFRDETFDVATASFVLSHIRDYPRALAETLRVLKTSGDFGVSNWAPPSDPFAPAWNDCLAEAISRREAEHALKTVAPWEIYFSMEGNLEAALKEAGFSVVDTHTVELEFSLTVDQFLEDRELSSAGRLALHLLGPDRWARFRAATAEKLRERFGPLLQYRRSAFIVVARKP